MLGKTHVRDIQKLSDQTKKICYTNSGMKNLRCSSLISWFVLAVLFVSTGLLPERLVAQPLAAGKSKFLGCSIRSVRSNFSKYFNQVTPENAGKWGSVEGGMDSYNWTPLDTIYKYALANGFPYKHHALVWGQQYPSWITTLDSASQRAQVEEWIRLVGTRYPKMHSIDVVNEPLPNHAPAPYANALGGSGKTGWDWVITAFRWARQYCAPGVQLILNEYNIVNSNIATDNLLKLIDTLKVRGLIDAVGIQCHYGELKGVNPSTIQNNLDRIAAKGLPIYISEFEINEADDAVQLQNYKTYFPLLWEHPGVRGITFWGYVIYDIWQTNGYLLDERGAERPALKWLRTNIISPPRPVPISPMTAGGVQRNPVLVWHPSDSATSYHVQASGDILFTSTVIDTTVKDTLVQLKPLAANTRYYWRVSGVNQYGESEYSTAAVFVTGDAISSVETAGGIPADYRLSQNYPNPFNPATRITFSLPERSHVSLKIYSLLGSEVATLVDGIHPAGTHEIVFNAQGLGSGVYLYRLSAKGVTLTKKCILLR
ncbi:MAG: endo-1,4-beta-xylanase [bacterium]